MGYSQQMSTEELVEEFEFLGSWDEQCRYLMEIGEELPDLPPEDKVEENRVHGCQARVWVVSELHQEPDGPHLAFRAKSDARIVDGLIVVLLTLFDGKSPRDILQTDHENVIRQLGLESHLVPQRRNGLYAMVQRIRAIAQSAAGSPTPEELHDAHPPSSAEITAHDGNGAARITPLPVTEDEESAREHRDLDADAVRAQFPALQQVLDSGLHVTYLDTAASAQKPQVVIDKEAEVYEKYYANAYRGVYRFGNQVDQELEQTRAKVQRLIGAGSTQEIVFTSGTTMAINLVANAWGRKFLQPGDEILLTELEHHANLVPWQWVAKQTGAELRYIPITDEGLLDLSKLDELLTSRTKMVAVTGMSNVLGTSPPIREISDRARAVGARVLVDGAQSVPHIPTDVIKDGIDFLTFSGHKLYGPSGVGVLYGRRDLLEEMDPFLCGGHMIEHVYRDHSTWAPLPAKFEAGTLPIAQAIALGTAVDFIRDLGFCPIHHHEQDLLRYAWERMQQLPGLTIFGPPPADRGAILSFALSDAAAQDIAQLLDLRGVFVRHGHHCTMPLHERLGVPATIRASFSIYNTRADVDTLCEAIEFARRRLHLA